MSYDIRLCDPVTHETLEVDSPHLMAGGTYALEGTTELWLNVTYNYARHYHCLGERGIREIYGKTGAESIPMLKAAALRLGDDVSDDYWEATRATPSGRCYSCSPWRGCAPTAYGTATERNLNEEGDDRPANERAWRGADT